jgi:hypothetical protein
LIRVDGVPALKTKRAATLKIGWGYFATAPNQYHDTLTDFFAASAARFAPRQRPIGVQSAMIEISNSQS